MDAHFSSQLMVLCRDLPSSCHSNLRRLTTMARKHPISYCSKWTSKSEAKYEPFLLEFAVLKQYFTVPHRLCRSPADSTRPYWTPGVSHIVTYLSHICDDMSHIFVTFCYILSHFVTFCDILESARVRGVRLLYYNTIKNGAYMDNILVNRFKLHARRCHGAKFNRLGPVRVRVRGLG